MNYTVRLRRRSADCGAAVANAETKVLVVAEAGGIGLVIDVGAAEISSLGQHVVDASDLWACQRKLASRSVLPGKSRLTPH